MKLKFLLPSLLAVAFLAAGLTACVSTAEKQARLEARARISRADAEMTALEKVPGGTVKEGELEKEHGKLIWSFDIATTGTKDITEVQVDALTGAVVDVSKETPAQQEKEEKDDARKK